MAENTEVFKVEIEGQERAIKSMKDLKSAIKDAQDSVIAGTPGANKALAQLKDRMEEVRESANSVKGGGVEPLRNSFGLLKDGLSNLDFDKVGTAFKGLGAAMKAVPVLLMVEAITYLVTNFKELSEGTGILAKVLQPLGDLIGWLKDGLYALTDAIGLTNTALDEMGEAATENATKAKEALSQQNAEYDRQIQVAKAAGKSTVELEKAKQEAIVETNKAIVEQIIAFVRAGGVLDDEKKKLITSSLEAIKNAKTQEKVIELTHQKEVNQKYQEALEERKRLKSLEFDANMAYNQEEGDAQLAQLAQIEQAKIDAGNADLEREKALNAEKLALSAELTSIAIQQKKREAAEKEAIDKQTAEQSFAVAKTSIDSQAQLVNFLFDLKRSRLQKGSAEELAAAKRQFQINKALAVTNSVISGIQGVINALSAQSVIPEPYGTILKVANAVAVGVAATVNTAKIASQQFNEGGGGGGGGASASVGSAATAAPPVPSINTPQNTPPSTQFDEQGKNLNQPIVKAQVVETELTEKQSGVARLENQAKF